MTSTDHKPSDLSSHATNTPSFWEEIYSSGDIGFDLGGPHPTLHHVLQLGLLRGRNRVLVPGCGRGHDAFALAESGHEVVVVDFAEQPIAEIRARALAADVSIEAVKADIFDLIEQPASSFDAVYEYTCFVAIDPGKRIAYRDMMSHLVRPGGRAVERGEGLSVSAIVKRKSVRPVEPHFEILNAVGMEPRVIGERVAFGHGTVKREFPGARVRSAARALDLWPTARDFIRPDRTETTWLATIETPKGSINGTSSTGSATSRTGCVRSR